MRNEITFPNVQEMGGLRVDGDAPVTRVYPAKARAELCQPPVRQQHFLSLSMRAERLIERDDPGLRGVSDAANLVSAGRHCRAAIEDIDIVFPSKTFELKHAHSGATCRVGNAHDGTGRFRQHGRVYRVFGHKVCNKLIAVHGVEFIGLLKVHAKKPSGNAIPKGGAGRFIDDAPQLCQGFVGEPGAVIADE